MGTPCFTVSMGTLVNADPGTPSTKTYTVSNVSDNNGCSGKYIQAIARFVTKCRQENKEVILVSSGSVAAGRHLIQHGSPIPSIPTKQAMASVGQMKMMANWQRFFDVPLVNC